MASGLVPNMLMTLSFVIVSLLVKDAVFLLDAAQRGVHGRVIFVTAQGLFNIDANCDGGEHGDNYETGAQRAVRCKHYGAQAKDG